MMPGIDTKSSQAGFLLFCSDIVIAGFVFLAQSRTSMI